MGKSKTGKKLPKGICQRKDGMFSARYLNGLGKRVEKHFKLLSEAKQYDILSLSAKAAEKEEHSMKKRWIACLLALLMTVGLFACGGQTAENVQEPTVTDAPTRRRMRRKPFSRQRGWSGSPAESIYSCTTSSASIPPVFVTVTAAPSAVRRISEYAKRVYESPKPKEYSGGVFSYM